MLHIFDPVRTLSFAAILIKLLLSFLLGALIGLERSYHNKPAGFRTHILVVLGACIASLTGLYLYINMHLPTDVSRIAAGVVTGLGFIGAGTIIVTRKQTVKGLTTAAGLWTSGLIGLAVGAGFFEGGILGTMMILLVETYFTSLRSRIQLTPEFEIALSYHHRTDLDNVMRYCKDQRTYVRNLRIRADGDGPARYTAILELQADNERKKAALIDQIRIMPGIISAAEL